MLIFFSILLLLSLVSYRPDEIPFIQSPPARPVVNFIGPFGAWLAFVSFMTLGAGAFLLVLMLAGAGVLLIVRREGRLWPKWIWMAVVLLACICLVELAPENWRGFRERMNLASPGGALGLWLGRDLIIRFFGALGAGLVLAAFLLVSLILLLEVHPVALAQKVGQASVALWQRLRKAQEERRDRHEALEREAAALAKRRRRLEAAMADEPSRPKVRPAVYPSEADAAPPSEKSSSPSGQAETPPLLEVEAALPTPRPRRESRTRTDTPAPKATAPAAPVASPTSPESTYQLPPLSLLDPLPPASEREIQIDSEGGAALLKETLNEFGVEVDVTNVQQGPVVTRYELLPAPGVKVERITALSNNIALAMKAESVRIQAPIPGKGVVGIEVPNPKTVLVTLREVLESDVWTSDRAALPLALGKDVSGRVLISDLADMPHLLIAGATGSGKTVCMNSILAGLLMARTPQQLRLMLIDPKIVEFSAYNHLPHLVVPVITDPKKVPLGLRWAIAEMEKRYRMFAKVGVRNIAGFNSRPIVRQTDLFPDAVPGGGSEEAIPDRLPYLVIVVDELADLMLVAQTDIETQITRLAQLSRATGIHMILATQRPSVNVITGTIKANIPARISFQVAQKVDSRTILDANGADKLLGRGDLLFLPPGVSRLVRAQGTLTTDGEIRGIVEHCRAQGPPQYELAIKDKIEGRTPDLPEMEEEDELLEAALEIIRQTKRASTSMLQRRLRIGYTRAARIMDLLEQRGVVGPAQGSDPREILIDLDGDIPQNREDEPETER